MAWALICFIKLFDFKFRLLSLYIREVDIFYILSFSFNEKQGIRNRKKGGRGRKDWKQSKSSSDLSQNYRVLKKAVHGYLIPILKKYARNLFPAMAFLRADQDRSKHFLTDKVDWLSYLAAF